MENSIENLNKDKEYVIPNSETKAKEPEITVHSMPARYLQVNTGAKKAKNTGLIILVGGVVFIIVAVALGYYFLFYRAKSQPISETQDQAKIEESTAKDLAEKEPAKKIETKKENTKVEKATTTKEEEITKEETTGDELVEDVFIGDELLEEVPEELYQPSPDTDQDGLTDAEEVLLDSDINEIDTDGDGYGDLSEILNLYDPIGSGKLVENANIEKYINSKYNYYIYYPSVWLEDEVDGDDSIIFRLGKNQFIQIIVQPNEKRQKIEDWYEEQFNANILPESTIVNKKNWTGMRSKDGLIVYLADPKNENIFTVTYNLGMDHTLYYKNIFEVMVNSLEVNN